MNDSPSACAVASAFFSRWPARSVAVGWCLTGLLLVLALLGPPVLASESSTSQQTRPRIGLVLGGGGAKGAAHIGVLRVLDELRIPIHCVAGTSMGALVGGVFASGMSPETLEQEARAIDWGATIGGEGNRDKKPIERKLAGQMYTNTLELGLREGRLRTPSGFLQTQAIEDVIRDLVSDARWQASFDSMAIPFRAIATDMVKGEMISIGSGDLSVAMRASMAVPGAFSPVVQGDKVLSDGGLVRNLPVDVARELCADVVIAVWLSTPQPVADDLANAVALAGRFLDVVIDANQRAQIETLADDDVGIEVPMGDITSADFQRTAEAIDLGRAAAEAMAGKLRRLSLPEDDYLAWRANIDAPLDAGTAVAEVRIVGLDQVPESYVRKQLRNLRPDSSVTTAQIKADTDAIYELGDFERVDYRISGPMDARVVEVIPVEKPWGPNFLRFDLGLDAAGNGELQAILRAEHTRVWINGRGGRWNNILQLGQQTILQTDLYQPLDVEQSIFLQPKAALESDLENVYVDGSRVSRYFLRDLFAQLDLGWNFDREAQLRTGFRAGWVESKLDTGVDLLPQFKRQGENVFIAGMVYDTRDNAALATSGTFMNLRYWKAGDGLGGDVEYSLAEAVATRTWLFRGNTLNLLIGGGAEITGELPPTRDFRLGGIRSFPGLQPGELRGSSYWLASGSYRWKIADILSLFGQSLYAGMRLQVAQMGDRRDAINDGTLYGVAGSLNARTPVGALSLSLGWVSNDSVQLQFSLGRPIAEGSLVDETF